MILLEKAMNRIKMWLSDEYWLWFDEIPRIIEEAKGFTKSMFKSGRIVLYLLGLETILSLIFSTSWITFIIFILFLLYYRDRRKKIGLWKGNMNNIKKYNLKVNFWKTIYYILFNNKEKKDEPRR